MDHDSSKENQLSLAERVRTACVEAALQGYEQAALGGLCHEGAWEAAIDSVRRLDLKDLLQRRADD
jgi:hypothetical protein